MKSGTNRLRLAVATGAVLMLAATACGGSGGSASGDDTITYGYWEAGGVPAVTTMATLHMAEATIEGSGLNVEMKAYPNLDALYADLARGRIDAVSAGPASVASMAARGAPVGVAGVTARSSAAIVSKGKEFTAEALRGSRIAAPTSTATWQMVKLAIEDRLGLKAQEDYEVVSAQGLAGPVNQVASGTADYGMSFGDTLAEALDKFGDVEVVASPEELAGEGGKPFWQFTVTVNTDRVSPQESEKLFSVMEDSVAWLQNNPGEVAAKAEEEGASSDAARLYEQYVKSGKSNWEPTGMNESVCGTLMGSFERLKKIGFMEEVPSQSYCYMS